MVEADQGPDEQAESVGVLLRLGDGGGVACTALHQHLLQGFKVVRGERLVAAQPLQRHVILVGFEVGGGFGLEPFHVGAGCEHRQVDGHRCGQLVLEGGVDDVFLGLVEELQQPAQAASGRLQHRQCHVDPPLVAGDFVEQFLLGGYRRDRGLPE